MIVGALPWQQLFLTIDRGSEEIEVDLLNSSLCPLMTKKSKDFFQVGCLAVRYALQQPYDGTDEVRRCVAR